MRTDPESSLSELMGEHAAGDDDAFDAVFRALRGPVLEVVVRILRDPAMADEVVQEVLLEVWIRPDRFDPRRGSAAAWASAIARHRAIDRVRSEQAAAARDALFAARSADVPYDQVVEIAERRDEYEHVRASLAGLERLHLEVVSLVYFDGLTTSQAAGRLGVSPSAVRSRLAAAREALRQDLTASN